MTLVKKIVFRKLFGIWKVSLKNTFSFDCCRERGIVFDQRADMEFVKSVGK